MRRLHSNSEHLHLSFCRYLSLSSYIFRQYANVVLTHSEEEGMEGNITLIVLLSIDVKVIYQADRLLGLVW